MPAKSKRGSAKRTVSAWKARIAHAALEGSAYVCTATGVGSINNAVHPQRDIMITISCKTFLRVT